jgi:hypothetical protein
MKSQYNYDALINSKMVYGITLKALQAYQLKGYDVTIIDKYKASEDDYNSIAINKSEW